MVPETGGRGRGGQPVIRRGDAGPMSITLRVTLGIGCWPVGISWPVDGRKGPRTGPRDEQATTDEHAKKIDRAGRGD